MQCGGVDDHRELSGFVVGQSSDAKSSSEFASCVGESLVVVGSRCWHDVEIEGLSSGSVELGAEAANEHIVDAVMVEDVENSSRVEPVLLR